MLDTCTTGQRLARGLQPSLHRVSAQQLDVLPRTVVAYRLRRLGRFELKQAQRFELVFRDPGAEPMRVEGRRDQNWKTKPEAMPAGNASRLLRELSQPEAADIEAESMTDAELAAVGLLPPRVAITVWGAEEEGGEERVVAEIDLGAVDEDGGIIARARKGGPAYRLDPSVAERVPVSEEAFRGRFLTEKTPRRDE